MNLPRILVRKTNPKENKIKKTLTTKIYLQDIHVKKLVCDERKLRQRERDLKNWQAVYIWNNYRVKKKKKEKKFCLIVAAVVFKARKNNRKVMIINRLLVRRAKSASNINVLFAPT